MELLEKIQTKKARIGIIGLGYIGLPLVREFLHSGFSVTGFDIDETKIEMLKKGTSYIKHIDVSVLNHYSPVFIPTSDFTFLSVVDCIIICVPTPLNKYREPDLQYVFNTTKTIAANLRNGQLIVLESTTYPGTTEEMKEILESGGLNVGKDFYLAFSPEREDPNNKDFNTRTTPKIVGGYTDDCLTLAKTLYDFIVDKTVPVSSIKVAESAKLLENIYRAVNIALVNELKQLFDRMDIDIWEVIDAAKTKPFGFQPFYPGPGLGGHCIPIDPFYLTWKAREFDLSTRFIELAGEINTNMPYYVVENAKNVLNRFGKAINNARIIILGIAYKKDIDDQRESPALKIISLLRQNGANVLYNDPYVPVSAGHRGYPKMEIRSVELTEELLHDSDLVLLITDHTDFNYEFIEKHANLILDTRNGFRKNGIFSKKVFL